MSISFKIMDLKMRLLCLAFVLSVTATQEPAADQEPVVTSEPAAEPDQAAETDQATTTVPEPVPSGPPAANDDSLATNTTNTTDPSPESSLDPTTPAPTFSPDLPLATPLPPRYDPAYESIGGATLYNLSNIYDVLADIAAVQPIEELVKAALPPKPKIDDDAFSTRTIVYKYINALNNYEAAHTFCHRERFRLYGPTNYDSLSKMRAFSPTTIWVNITQDFKRTPGVTGVYTYADGTPVPHVFYHRPSNWQRDVIFAESLDNNQKCAIFDFSTFTYLAEDCDKKHEFFLLWPFHLWP